MSTTPSEGEDVAEMPATAHRSPSTPAEIVETELPAPGLERPMTSAVHPSRTRHTIALVLLSALIGLATVGSVGWLMWGDDTDRMQNFAIVFSPITGILGTVIGFYFSAVDRDHR